MNMQNIKLTSLAHDGGCGCKHSPAVLQELLANQPSAGPFRNLLVGTETGDDAAVWQIDDNNCVVATTDFFMPVVDDPNDFGRIAATNAISDIYAMGAKPIMALAILGMPLEKVSTEVVREIIKGGSSVCASAGIPVAGGHSIDAPEPIYGLAVIGLCKPEQVRRNRNALAGDALILTKGIGVGVYSAAIKKGNLTGDLYGEMVASTTLLNKIGMTLGDDADVHSVTDVTGFGLLGHGLEMAEGSDLQITIRMADVPLFKQAENLAKQGFVTGASKRNWVSYGKKVETPADFPEWARDLLTDPQTSGGLLVACSQSRAESLVKEIVAAGYPSAKVIGTAEAGKPGVRVIA